MYITMLFATITIQRTQLASQACNQVMRQPAKQVPLVRGSSFTHVECLNMDTDPFHTHTSRGVHECSMTSLFRMIILN